MTHELNSICEVNHVHIFLTLVARRVTLVIAFGLSPKILGGDGDLQMLFHQYDCRLSGGDTERWWGHKALPAVIEKIWTFSIAGGGDTKTSRLHPCVSSRHLAPEPPGETFTNNFVYLVRFSNKYVYTFVEIVRLDNTFAGLKAGKNRCSTTARRNPTETHRVRSNLIIFRSVTIILNPENLWSKFSSEYENIIFSGLKGRWKNWIVPEVLRP